MSIFGNALLVLLLQLHGIVSVASRTTHHAWRLRRGMAAVARCAAMRASRDGKVPIMIDRNPHPTQAGADAAGGRGRQQGRVDECRAPSVCDVALRAIPGKRRRRCRAPMSRMNIRVQVVARMTCEAIALHRRPLALSVSLMAFRTVGERVHPGQREARATMDLERLQIVPATGGMTAVAPSAQARLMGILVARIAIPGDSSLRAMTCVARDRFVPSSEWKSGARMIEAFAFGASGDVPPCRRVTVAAVEVFDDRAVSCSCGRGSSGVGILGQRDAHGAGEPSHDDGGEPGAPHRPPFLRA